MYLVFYQFREKYNIDITTTVINEYGLRFITFGLCSCTQFQTQIHRNIILESNY